MRRKPKVNKKEIVSLINNQINEYFRLAKVYANKDPLLANRYVELARKLSTRFRVRIPSELKKRYCKHCKRYLIPSRNCRVRTKEGKLVYYCLECKNHMRFPFYAEQKKRRKQNLIKK